jgi:hypothetical protein
MAEATSLLIGACAGVCDFTCTIRSEANRLKVSEGMEAVGSADDVPHDQEM